MEKNNMPVYEVWAYDMPSEYDLKIAKQNGGVVDVRMMRRHRAKNCDSLVYRVPAKLRVLDVRDRRRKNVTRREVGSMHRELAVEVEMAENAPKGILNSDDDKLGLSAFTAGTRFTLVYCPDDRTRAARVSRASDVLYVRPTAADEDAAEAEETPDA